VRILPARNNFNLVPYPVSALFNISQNGNTNLQYITSIYGALEYITNYITKMEKGDSNEVINLAIKLLTIYDEPIQGLLNAVNLGRIVSSTEASCYLLGYPVLKYTSSFKFVSPKPCACLHNVLDLQTKTQMSSTNMKLREHYTLCKCSRNCTITVAYHFTVLHHRFRLSMRLRTPRTAKNLLNFALVHAVV
jgi:hypothetical protein